MPGPNYNRGGPRRTQPPIVSDPAVVFYLDNDKKQLNPELVSTIAEEKADRIRGDLGSAQLRRFFGEVKGIYHLWQNANRSDEFFQRVFPLIKMMKSKVYYASNPRKPKIPGAFAGFLLGGIDQIKDGRDFEAFVLYFEAVVGFMYGKGMVSK